MPRITEFNGHSFGGVGDDYRLDFLAEHSDWALDVDMRQRFEQYPERRSWMLPERVMPFVVTPVNPVTYGAARRFLQDVFAPGYGLRQLTALHDDDATEMFVMVDVVTVMLWPDLPQTAILKGNFVAADPAWRSTATFTSTTVAGDYFALPEITLAGGAGCTRTRVRIRDTSGRGLAGHPVALGLSLGNQSWVFDRGRSVPFVSGAQGWIRVGVPAGRSIYVDVYGGTGIENPAADTLLLGGFDPDSSDNGSFVVDVSAVEWSPSVSGEWTLAKVGQVFNVVSYGFARITSGPHAGSSRLAIRPRDSLARDADAIQLLSSAGISAVSGLTIEVADSLNDDDYQAFVKTWREGEQFATTAATLTTNGTLSFPALGSDVVAVAIGIEPLGTTKDTTEGSPTEGDYISPSANVYISGTATVTIAQPPTVDVIETAAAVVYNGSIRNDTSGDEIEFVNVFFDDVPVVVDCYNHVILPESGPSYDGGQEGDGVYFENSHLWFRLMHGANDISSDFSESFSYRNRYVIG